MFGEMSDEHPACRPIDKLLAECDVRHERRSGPGGQHRNKVATAVVIEHRPTGVRAEANERRSQADNHREAVRRLRLRLAMEVRSSGANTAESGAENDKPSELWRSRAMGGRLAVNPGHEDFPALVAEALDCLAQVEFEMGDAAEKLQITSSQLVKLLKLEPAVWQLVSDERRRRGLKAYH
jgi:hypothetical protein